MAEIPPIYYAPTQIRRKHPTRRFSISDTEIFKETRKGFPEKAHRKRSGDAHRPRLIPQIST